MTHDTTTTPPSLWTKGPTVFSRAVQGAFGFELFDLIGLLVLVFGGFFLRPLVGLPPWVPVVLGGLGAIGLWCGKRGKPRGAIPHLLHELDLPPLPGLLPPIEQWYHPWS